MTFLASLVVGRPLLIFAVAALFPATFLVLRRTSFGAGRRLQALLYPGAAWTIYGLWELLVQIRTPEANIRVDLLVIWPVLLFISLWYTVRAFAPDAGTRR